MKRIVSLLLAVVMLFALASCGGKEEDATGEYVPDADPSPSKSAESVLFEKSVTVTTGRDVKVKFYGRDGGLSSIGVTPNGAEEVKHDISEASEKVLGRVEYAVSDDPEFKFFTEDVNFDGYLDFAIQSWKKDGGTPYYCWFWSTLENTYTFGAALENPVFDRANSKIYCDVTEGNDEYINVYSVLNGSVMLETSQSVTATPSFETDLSAFEQYMNPADRDGFLILANKETELGEDYIPENLVDIANTRQDGRATAQMVETAAKALEALYIDMYAAGYTDVSVTSAYRSYADQKYIFDGFLNQNLADGYDYDTALAMVLSDTAAPGTSEHQTGLCCDMHSSPSADAARTQFPTTPAFKWLTDNAWKYGFILRYPEDKVDITGYSYESWHYRFVGRYHAAKIHVMGLCLEEYLQQINK